MDTSRTAFEAHITESYCGHLRGTEFYERSREALLRRSQVKGYENDYQHQAIHYQWLGWRAAWNYLEQKGA